MNFTITALIVGLIFGGLGGYKFGSGEAESLRADYAQASKEAIEQAQKDFQEKVIANQKTAEYWAKVASDEKQKTDHLNSDIAAGKFRVYVRATCPKVSSASTDSGAIAAEARPELTGQTYERADKRRAELKQLLIDYSELQDYVNNLRK